MKVYGAIAGATLDNDVKEATFDSGFYVITQTDDNTDVIEPPENFVPKFWNSQSGC